MTTPYQQKSIWDATNTFTTDAEFTRLTSLSCVATFNSIVEYMYRATGSSSFVFNPYITTSDNGILDRFDSVSLKKMLGEVLMPTSDPAYSPSWSGNIPLSSMSAPAVRELVQYAWSIYEIAGQGAATQNDLDAARQFMVQEQATTAFTTRKAHKAVVDVLYPAVEVWLRSETYPLTDSVAIGGDNTFEEVMCAVSTDVRHNPYAWYARTTPGTLSTPSTVKVGVAQFGGGQNMFRGLVQYVVRRKRSEPDKSTSALILDMINYQRGNKSSPSPDELFINLAKYGWAVYQLVAKPMTLLEYQAYVEIRRIENDLAQYGLSDVIHPLVGVMAPSVDAWLDAGAYPPNPGSWVMREMHNAFLSARDAYEREIRRLGANIRQGRDAVASQAKSKEYAAMLSASLGSLLAELDVPEDTGKPRSNPSSNPSSNPACLAEYDMYIILKDLSTDYSIYRRDNAKHAFTNQPEKYDPVRDVIRPMVTNIVDKCGMEWLEKFARYAAQSVVDPAVGDAVTAFMVEQEERILRNAIKSISNKSDSDEFVDIYGDIKHVPQIMLRRTYSNVTTTANYALTTTEVDYVNYPKRAVEITEIWLQAIVDFWSLMYEYSVPVDIPYGDDTAGSRHEAEQAAVQSAEREAAAAMRARIEKYGGGSLRSLLDYLDELSIQDQQ